MANLKEAIEYASKNPNSPFAKELEQVVKSGAVDKEAKELGINLEPIKTFNVTPSKQGSTDGKTLGNLGSRIVSSVKKRGDALASEITNTEQNPILSGVKAVAQGFGALNDVAGDIARTNDSADAILGKTEEIVGKGFNKAVDTLSRTNLIEGAAESGDKIIGEDLLEGVAATGEIAGTIAGAEGSVASATKTLNTAKNLGTSAVSKTTNALKSITKNTSKYPEKIINSITDSKINPQVKTILGKTSVEKFDRYVKAGEEALSDPSVLTPLERAGETANNLLPKMKEDLGNIGRQKAATLESVGNTKAPSVTETAVNSLREQLQKKLTDSERSLIRQTLDDLEALGKNPTVKSVDSTIDKLQSTVFERKGGTSIPVTSRTQSVVNSAIKDVNDKLKGFVDKKLGSNDYSKLNLEWRNRNKIFQELNKRLGEDGNRGGSLLKRFFSPQDGGTKKLFKAINDYYGVDLAQDATIAKFVMDTLGDTRAQSLLELPPTTVTGVIGKVLKYAEDKAVNPKRVIKRARSSIK